MIVISLLFFMLGVGCAGGSMWLLLMESRAIDAGIMLLQGAFWVYCANLVSIPDV